MAKEQSPIAKAIEEETIKRIKIMEDTDYAWPTPNSKLSYTGSIIMLIMCLIGVIVSIFV